MVAPTGNIDIFVSAIDGGAFCDRNSLGSSGRRPLRLVKIADRCIAVRRFTPYSSTASGPPSLTREGSRKSRFWIIDGCAFYNRYDLGPQRTSVPTIKKDNGRRCILCPKQPLSPLRRLHRQLPSRGAIEYHYAQKREDDILPYKQIIHFSSFNIHFLPVGEAISLPQKARVNDMFWLQTKQG